MGHTTESLYHEEEEEGVHCLGRWSTYKSMPGHSAYCSQLLEGVTSSHAMSYVYDGGLQNSLVSSPPFYHGVKRGLTSQGHYALTSQLQDAGSRPFAGTGS